MLEKGLQAGNLAAAFGVIATTVDLTFAGGAATFFTAALSAKALAPLKDKSAKDLARFIAKSLDDTIAGSHQRFS